VPVLPILLAPADHLLRGVGAFDPRRVLTPRLRPLVLIAACFGALYGGVMGSYNLHAPERLLQVVYSAIKVPILLAGTTLVCLPAFFVLNSVVGLRDDFSRALRAIIAGQATLGVCLAALAPLTRLWYFSVPGHDAALLFNAAMFALAALGAQRVIFRWYGPLLRRDPRHRALFVSWFALYGFVGIQMGWMLRPFVGSPGLRVTFFRPEPFTNAYVVIVRLVFGS